MSTEEDIKDILPPEALELYKKQAEEYFEELISEHIEEVMSAYGVKVKTTIKDYEYDINFGGEQC